MNSSSWLGRSLQGPQTWNISRSDPRVRSRSIGQGLLPDDRDRPLGARLHAHRGVLFLARRDFNGAATIEIVAVVVEPEYVGSEVSATSVACAQFLVDFH